MVDEYATITGKQKPGNKVSPRRIWRVKRDLEVPKRQGTLQTEKPLVPLRSGIQISSTVMARYIFR